MHDGLHHDGSPHSIGSIPSHPEPSSSYLVAGDNQQLHNGHRTHSHNHTSGNGNSNSPFSPEVTAAVASGPGGGGGATFASSPGNLSITSDILLTAGGASIGWLDLLASDAAMADASFSLVPPPQAPESGQRLGSRLQSIYDGTPLDEGNAAAEQQIFEEDARLAQRHYLQQQFQVYLEQYQLQQQQQQQQAAQQQLEEQRRQQQEQERQQAQQAQQQQHQYMVRSPTAPRHHPQQLPPDGDKSPWQELEDIVLLEHEKELFRSFVEHAASWVSGSPTSIVVCQLLYRANLAARIP